MDFIARRLADALGLLHVQSAAVNAVVGLRCILVWKETGAVSEAWWAIGMFMLAYYILREHNRFCEDCARIFKDDN